MNCESAEELILDALDGSPSDQTIRALDAHVARCESCARFRAAQTAIDAALTASLATVSTDDAAIERIRQMAVDPTAKPWLPDVLNAGGIAAMVALFASMGLQGMLGSVLLFSLLLLVGYPLLVVRPD